MRKTTSRREFVKATGALGLGVWLGTSSRRADGRSPNDKLNIAAIGVGGKGRTDIRECAGENIVALCDPDEARAAESFEKYPMAKRYHDYRKMLEERKDLDAVIVSTPDHSHAPASVMAMRMGLHVYCQKPLTHSIHEARVMRKTAQECKVATQMGNQGHANDGTRQIVELVRAGAIGKVRDVHVWTDRPGKYWRQPLDRPAERPPVPKHLKWDLWLGPAPERPYHPVYCPHDWRAWWDFGTGAMGDMGCHVMDASFWALDLDHPTSVEAEVPSLHPETAPTWEIITYQFPARGDLPPVTLKWYDAGKQPPQELGDGKPLAETGSLLIGDEGTLYIPDPYGTTFKLLPEEKFADYKGPDPTLPRAHDNPYKEWIAACKGGQPSLSNFDYAALLTETILLGNVAVRIGKRIEWDAQNMRCSNAPEADGFIRREYRPGWTL
jgi:predicted dehydrogenase